MTLLKDIIGVSPELRKLLQAQFGLVTNLLDFNFDFASGPKFKSSESRKNSFELLAALTLDSPENLSRITAYLAPLIKSGDWRTSALKDWEILPKKNEKSSTGYVGIKNLGCSKQEQTNERTSSLMTSLLPPPPLVCYMNSLLQQLYMIPSFRRIILRCEDKNFEKISCEDNLMYQLKCMFTALEVSEKEAYNPKSLCNSLKDYDGNPTNVFE